MAPSRIQLVRLTNFERGHGQVWSLSIDGQQVPGVIDTLRPISISGIVCTRRGTRVLTEDKAGKLCNLLARPLSQCRV